MVESEDARAETKDEPARQRKKNDGKGAKRSWRRTVLRVALASVGVFVVLLVGAGVFVANYLHGLNKTLPGVDAMLQARGAEPSILLSASGTHLATFSRGHFARVSLDEVSPYVVQALIAVEDHRFYEHKGIDYERTLGALWYTLRGNMQGGSTLTQQLARNMFPVRVGRERTLERKLREMLTALKIEQTYTKDEILETYLNSVPFLYQVTGIEMAARTYFDKSAADLDLLESATLVGMLKGTSYYNPVLHPERAQRRRNIVLQQMVRHGMLDAAVLQRLRNEPLNVQLTRQPDPLGSAPHFAAHVRRQLIEWAEANDYNIYTDGLIVHSTIDDRFQQAAAAAVERQTKLLQDIADVEWAQRDARVASQSPAHYTKLRKKIEPFSRFWEERPGLLEAFVRESREFRRAQNSGESAEAALQRLLGDERFIARLREFKTRLEAGFVAIDPRSGEVKAWIGSRNFEIDQFDHVAQAVRQPGSTFKPFVYGAALEHGLRPELQYPDGKIEIRLSDGGVWRPTDMSGFSNRLMSMREGLVFSKNTITAQVMLDVGVEQVARLAKAVGIRSSRLRLVPSLSLGTSPVTLLEMVSSYATIAQTGEYHAPLTIKRITDREGKVIAEFSRTPEYVMSEETALELIDMMRGVVRQGTGTEVRNRFNITADIAGKTGTTQYNTDGWFILMHPELVAGAWVGFNDQRVTMRSDYWGQGGRNAVLLVGDFFRDTLRAKLIDAKARFPQANRPPPLMVRAPLDEGAHVVQGIDLLPDGHGYITSSNGETMVILTPDGHHEVERRASAPPSAPEQRAEATDAPVEPPPVAAAPDRAASASADGVGERSSGQSGTEGTSRSSEPVAQAPTVAPPASPPPSGAAAAPATASAEQQRSARRNLQFRAGERWNGEIVPH
ncbi:MAG TPA: transglycosylase domain-containing protein [Noviherbaspirillum sp.]|nr:transglycosylase domain-containing protein [Noviherbaspirillum sp.]